jgi:hypothetical protein
MVVNKNLYARPGGGGATSVTNGMQRPTQAQTPAPQHHVDPLGNVTQWDPGGYTSDGTLFGVTKGQWRPVGNTRTAAGGGDGDGGYEDFDFDAALRKIQGALPPMPPPAAMPVPRVAPPGEPDRRRAESLEFGRAKDRIGRLGAGAMRSLRNTMAERGIVGSGFERAGEAAVIGQQQADLADTIQQQASTALARDERATDRNYAGELGQRQTDVGFNLNTRGQDMDYLVNRSQAMIPLLQLLASTRRRRAQMY